MRLVIVGIGLSPPGERGDFFFLLAGYIVIVLGFNLVALAEAYPVAQLVSLSQILLLFGTVKEHAVGFR